MAWRKALQHIGNQSLAKICAGAFVAKYEPERCYGFDDFATVVEARVGAGAKYAGKPRLMHKQSACGPEEVALYSYRGLELCHKRRSMIFFFSCVEQPAQ